MSSSSIFTTSLWRNLASSSSLKQISAPNRSVCAKCQHTRSWSLQRRRYHSDAESFSDMEAELLRRKRKTDAKRRQGGSEFVDHLIVTVRGGKGGSGASAFTAHPSKRGLGIPSGGNGGQGGSVYLKTSQHLTSLARISKRQIGEQGSHGAGQMKHGRRGSDVIVSVPVGTVVKEINAEAAAIAWAKEDDALGLNAQERRERKWDRWFVSHPNTELAAEEFGPAEEVLRKEGFLRRTTVDPVYLDITKPITEPILLSTGGRGGLGNPHFFQHDSPPPRLASKGLSPDTLTLSFELKLLADVGLVGLPNAGKSTILRALTGRGAEVAGYAFTTLNPQVGVVRVFADGSWKGEEGVVEESEVKRDREKADRAKGEYMPLPTKSRGQLETMRFTISDNPGLLARASENYGLGHSFLRSIERSLALVYVVDLGSEVPERDLQVLRDELEAYKSGLANKAVAVVLNKGDEVDEEVGRTRVKEVQNVVAGWGGGVEVVVVSAKFGLGMKRVVEVLSERVRKVRVDQARMEAEEEFEQ